MAELMLEMKLGGILWKKSMIDINKIEKPLQLPNSLELWEILDSYDSGRKRGDAVRAYLVTWWQSGEWAQGQWKGRHSQGC